MIAIIGAGISGLSLAYYLKKNGNTDFTLFEKEVITGGKISSSSYKGVPLEYGPNTLMTSPDLMSIIKELNLEQELKFPDETVVKNRYIGLNGKVKLLPAKPQKLLFSTLISFKSKIKLLKELRHPVGKTYPDETVSSFFNRHIGTELLDKFVRPFIRGIYAGDPDTLIMSSTFPKLVSYEKEYGSIIKGLKASSSIEKRKVFGFKKGNQTLTDTLALTVKDQLVTSSSIHLETKDQQLLINGQPYSKVIFACPAKAIATYLKTIRPTLSKVLEKINYAQLTVSHSIYDTPLNEFPYKGFGVLFPPSESKDIYGHLWNSSIYQNPSDKIIITSMSTLKDSNKLNKEISKDLNHRFQLNENQLIFRNDYLWSKAIPQYDMNHLNFLKIYKERTQDNLYICSNILDGVSIPDRISASKKLAKELSK